MKVYKLENYRSQNEEPETAELARSSFSPIEFLLGFSKGNTKLEKEYQELSKFNSHRYEQLRLALPAKLYRIFEEIIWAHVEQERRLLLAAYQLGVNHGRAKMKQKITI